MKLYLRYFLLCALFYLATSGIRNLAAQELGYIDSHSWMAEFAASSRRPTWQQEIKVNRVMNTGPLTAEDLEYGIKRSMWGWAERSESKARFTGVTIDDSGKTGSITFSWLNTVELFMMTGKFVNGSTRSWYNLDTGEIVGATIYLNIDAFQNGMNACALHTVSHEIGHAYGAFDHSSSTHDLMYSDQTHCRYAVTMADARLVGTTSPRCHVEVMDDGGIYIPEIAGQGAYLKSRGNNTWHLEQLTPVAGGCGTATVDSRLTVRVTNIKGYNFKYEWAELVHIGNDNWRLTGGE